MLENVEGSSLGDLRIWPPLVGFRLVAERLAARFRGKRKAVALAVATAADILQIAIFPAFVEGAASPFDDALDAVTAVVLLVVLGFRWRLALAFAAESVAGVAQSWTAVVISVPSAPAPALPAPAPSPSPSDSGG